MTSKTIILAIGEDLVPSTPDSAEPAAHDGNRGPLKIGYSPGVVLARATDPRPKARTPLHETLNRHILVLMVSATIPTSGDPEDTVRSHELPILYYRESPP